MQLEQFTKRQLIEMIKRQKQSNQYETQFYLQKIEKLEQEIRNLKSEV